MRAAYVVLAAAAFAGGCVTSNLIPCGDTICPQGLVCTTNGCAIESAVASCQQLAEGDSCEVADLAISNGRCLAGVCTAVGCGTGIIDASRGEVCADTNRDDGDGCSSDCKSTEVCGNGLVDAVGREQCDDGNTAGGDGCSSRCGAEPLGWQRLIADHIPEDAAIAFDTHRGVAVLFGGIVGFLTRGDTWELRGTTWQIRKTPHSPPALKSAALAYDAQRRVMVLFGGENDAGRQAQTWEYDGNDWKQVFPANSPSPRVTSMAYDLARRKTVLVGGFAVGALRDTWHYDGSNWTEAAEAGTAPVVANIAYMPSKQRIYGITINEANTGPRLRELWSYDGNTWRLDASEIAQDPYRGSRVFVDLLRDALYMHGGSFEQPFSEFQPIQPFDFVTKAWGQALEQGASGGVALSDPVNGRNVWQGGYEWFLACTQSNSQCFPSTRPSRRFVNWVGDETTQQIVGIVERKGLALFTEYDESSKRLIGIQSFNESPTFVFDGVRWNRLVQRAPVDYFPRCVVYDSSVGRVTLVTGLGDQVAIYRLENSEWRRVAEHRFMLNQASCAYDRNRNAIVVFSEGKTFEIVGSAMQEKVIEPPGAITRGPLVYDRSSQSLLLVGGSTLSGCSSQVWEYADGQWRRSGDLPTPQCTAAVTYDRIRQSVLALGATEPSSPTASLLRRQNQNWTKIVVPIEPPNGPNTSLAYHPELGRALLTNSLLPLEESWQFGNATIDIPEACFANEDRDQDLQRGCADDDCWQQCDPTCPPLAANCPADRRRCGDSVCDASLENADNCPADCSSGTCGDGVCDFNEVPATCDSDCGICGDGICASSEMGQCLGDCSL